MVSKINKIEEFLLTFSAKKTINLYRVSIKKYFNVINKNPDLYFDGKQDYKTDILLYRKSLDGKPPKTIRVYITAVKSFLIHYEVELPDSFWKSISRRIKGSEAITWDKIPTNEELKQILQYADIKCKSLFLLLSSSGMRIGEALQLKVNDVNFDECMINIRGEITKTGNRRITFFTSETRDVLREWLKVREKHLDISIKRAKALGYNKPRDKDTLFPINYTASLHNWVRLLKKAGLDEKDNSTDRLRMGIHSLRKYFYSNLKLAIPEIIVDALVGHKKGLKAVYGRYTEKQMRQEYEKGKHKLYVFETEVADERIQQLEEKITQRDNKVDLLKEQIDLLARHKGILEGEEDLGSDEIFEALETIDEEIKKLDGKEEIKEKKVEKPSAKKDDIQQMKKQMKEMMTKIEELEGK